MDNLYGKVHEWLTNSFASQIPDYEITEKSVNFLAKLSEISEQNNELFAIKTKSLNSKSDEYVAEASRIHRWLSHYNISPENLSLETRTLLNELTNLNIQLGVKPDEDVHNTKLALFDSHNSLIELDAELEVIEAQMKHVIKINDFAKRSDKTLNRILKKWEIEGNDLEDEEEMIPATENNNINEDNMEENVENLQFNLHTSHQDILKKLQEIDSLEDELEELNKKVEKFKELPPSEEGVLEVIENDKKELEQLELLLKEKLNIDMAFETNYNI